MIRRLRPGDEELHIELARQFKGDAPSSEQSRAFLDDERNWLLTAFADERPVGFALAYHLPRWDGRSHVLLYEIEVTEARRCQGYGRALVEEILGLARTSDAYKLWVQTSEENVAAMRLYESCGAERAPDDAVWGWRFN